MSNSPTSLDLTPQHALYIRLGIVQVLYGIYLVLYFKTMRLLLRPRARRKPLNRFYMLFSTLVLVLITIWIVTQLVLADLMWVVNYNYPGGPWTYMVGHTSDWYQIFGVAALLVLQLLTDALMIYRCYIVWDNYWVILMPCVLWLATCVTGILLDWSATFSMAMLSLRLSMSYFSLVSALNILITSLVCYRTMQYGLMVKKRLGKVPEAVYFGITAVVVESMLPYTFTGVLFLITLAIGSPWSQLFLSMNSMSNCISPQILILRLITGRTWKQDTRSPPTSLKFSAPSAAFESSASGVVPYPLEILALSARVPPSAGALESLSTNLPRQQESDTSGMRTGHKKSVEVSNVRV